MANSKKKCRHCKQYTTHYIQAPLGAFCDSKCASAYAMGKQQQKRENEFKKRTREFAKERGVRTTKKTPEQLTQDEYNRWIKLEEIYRCQQLGIQPECISCGKSWTEANNSDFACGHHKTRGARSDLAMDTRNTWLQCNNRCNSKLSGNITGQMGTRGYKEGLRIILGDDFDKTMAYLDKHKIQPKYSNEDYKRCRKWLSARNRKLKDLIALP